MIENYYNSEFAMKRPKETGLTLLELLFVIAIMAIIAAVAIPNITQYTSGSQTAKASRTVYAAWNNLASSAVVSNGATLTLDGQILTLTAGTNSQHIVTWVLPAHTTVSMNGQPFTCLSLNGDGIPTQASGCGQTTVTGNTVPSFWISVNGGQYVPAVS